MEFVYNKMSMFAMPYICDLGSFQLRMMNVKIKNIRYYYKYFYTYT